MSWRDELLLPLVLSIGLLMISWEFDIGILGMVGTGLTIIATVGMIGVFVRE